MSLAQREAKCFARDTSAPWRARCYAGALLCDWELETAVGDVQLIVTELVTNAIQHGRIGEVRVRIDLRGDALVVTVEDETPYVPLPPVGPTSTEGESGRGLLLVEALAACWGHGPVAAGPACGTAVWAKIGARA